MHDEPARPLSRIALGVLALLGLAAFAGLIALGGWQVQRLGWKQDLIERVERRLAAAPAAAPPRADWTVIGPDDVYRRVELRGRYDHARETCTQAVTRLGPGCWVLTPLQVADGTWVLVNRGFVDPQRRDPATRAAGQIPGEVRVHGLLRLSEPGGGFLRRNDPAANRWHSRDVSAIAAARGLPADRTAPYFVDATDSVPDGPVGGLTVVSFPNNHRVYALTWFALALMVPLAAVLIVRRERRLRAE